MRLALTEAGVPYELAMDMDDAWALALTVARAEHQGERFDWDRMQWKERRSGG